VTDRDVRWSKVKILKDLITSYRQQEQGGSGRIYFWLDADAAVTNWERRVEELVVGHEGKDLVLCKDGEGQETANTGAIIQFGPSVDIVRSSYRESRCLSRKRGQQAR
jgi:hypothetical protein